MCYQYSFVVQNTTVPKVSVIQDECLKDLLYSKIPIINNTILYPLKFPKTVDLMLSVLIKIIINKEGWGKLGDYILTSKPMKLYILNTYSFLYVNHTSIK